MADIFISYKSERRLAIAHLAQVLQNYGFDVWFDHGLVAGEDFARTIQRELRSARVVLVIWCPLSVQADWVLNEATDAKRRGTFTPVLLDPVDLPIEFIRADTIDLSRWDGGPRSYHLDRLIEQIASKVGRDPEPRFRNLVEQERIWRNAGAKRLMEYPIGDTETAPGSKSDAAAGDAPRAGKQESAAPSINTKPQNHAPTLFCSFCGESQHKVQKLIAGSDRFICNACVNLCSNQIATLDSNGKIKYNRNVPKEKAKSCNFCGKSQNDVKYIIAQTDSFICNECIGRCNEVINEVR